MDIISTVENALRNGELENDPHGAAEYRARLSGEYSFYAGQLADVLKEKPSLWNARRKDFKSDTACDRWFESTELGINETGLQLTLKRLEKLMQGLNALIKLHENEARNQF